MAAFLCFMTAAEAFVHCKQNSRTLGLRSVAFFRSEGVLWMGEGTEEKAAPLVTGEQLEIMLQEWDTPLVVDAYATWCGPCLLMAPEFEAAASELKGKVRFVKLDTDKEEAMAARLNIMGLPTLLFLDKYAPKEGEENVGARAVLKGRIEGALRKQNILDLVEHHFFEGPAPKMM
jgi:thioredoxin